MVNNCTVTIYVYGETGSGKSTLIRNLTLDGGAESSSTFIGTKKEGHHAFASGLRFIDTPGFRIPLPMSFDGWGLSSEWVKECVEKRAAFGTATAASTTTTNTTILVLLLRLRLRLPLLTTNC